MNTKSILAGLLATTLLSTATLAQTTGPNGETATPTSEVVLSDADIAALAQSAQPAQSGRRTNADKRADVLSMLDAHPDLSDREIARRVGVSPQTVNTWRKKAAA